MKQFLNVGLALSLTLISWKALASPGDLYQADFGSGTIFKYTPDGTQSVFASGLVSPSGLAFDSKGNLFVSDFGSNTIYMFTPAGVRSTFATGLNKPFGLVFDTNGNLFEGDRSGQIFKFTPTGTKTTFASGLNVPAGLAFDSKGTLFETDFGSGNIFVFNPAKNTFASKLTAPNGLVFDAAGNLLEADAGSGNIFKFTPVGVKSTFASALGQPTGLVFDDAGNLFVADNASGTISKIAPNGTNTVFATGLSNPQYLAIERPTAAPINISTRAGVQTGENVLIGGFIITGPDAKKVIVRAIGPSLANAGILSPLLDPTLELHDQTGAVLSSNDNWKTAQQAEIEATTLPPTDDRESAIVTTLFPGAYTAVVSGKNGAVGVALIEVYDLEQAANAKLANISTRAFVASGDKVMIGGFIIAGGDDRGRILVRALGPSLTQFGISGALPDPTLELHDANGATVAANDNWKDSQQAEIAATGLPPANDLESAIVTTLSAGAYTAVVAGNSGATGVGLVELYNLR